MRTAPSIVLLPLLALLAACPKPSELAAPDPLQNASFPADARGQALAGFRAYLVDGKPDDASARFDAALAKDAGDPYALLGRLYLEQRAGRPERGLMAALQLLEKAPRHPLASVAARYVLDLSGSAIPLDDAILARGQKALAAGAGGDAAHLLRSAIANIHAQRGEANELATTLSEMGTPDRFTLVGPFSAYSLLEFEKPTAPEQTGAFEEGMPGPYGKLPLRELRFFDGRMNLEGENPYGDVFLLGVDVEVKEAGTYTLRTVSSATHRVWLDGTLLVDRRDTVRPLPTVQSKGVALTPGKHRLVAKLVREGGAGSLTLSIIRSDGRPANLGFTAARGKAPSWGGVTGFDPPGAYASADALAAALRPEVGPVLAGFIAAKDGMGRDREGAKKLVTALAATLKSPAFAALRGELVENDRSLPAKVARGRATRFLEEVLAKDPKNVSALLVRAGMALDEERPLDAAEYVKQARAAATPTGFLVPMTEARLQLALNVDAQADRSAQEALELQPGLCEALSLRYDLARRRDAAALADGLVEQSASCPGSTARAAEHAALRGDLAKSVQLYRRLVERDPSQLGNSFSLANALAAQRNYAEAVELLRKLAQVWPRSAELQKRMAEYEELDGHADRALELREQALELDGSDLTLRRMVARAKTGKEPLEEFAVTGQEAIRAYEAKKGQEDTSATMVLDYAAIRAYPDGSMLDRVHVVQKALEQSGVQDIAEIDLPGGAQVLSLRTIKADGRVLEPENIAHKDTVSLPGVQVGDYVEYEYLWAHPPRGPAQPGFAASPFYYQVANSPNHWSTYRVIAPKGSGMTVDAHNMKAAEPIQTVGEEEVFFHEERRVPPFVPEPDAPPSGNEYLPFVQVGAGARGNDAVVALYSDNQLSKARITAEVEEFAKQAAGKKQGVDAVRAVYDAVMQKLTGRDAGLGVSASASIAQDRGSRLWTLKAALEAVGIPTQLVAVRTFAVDPAPYLFPNDNLLPYVCLRVTVPGAKDPIWLDPLIRFAPFGELPEQARGMEGLLLPEPGRPSGKVKTPAGNPEPGKTVELVVALGEDGVLTGNAVETYAGFDAAQISEALEQMSPQQRDQALQQALSRYFGGAELSKLKVENKREVGAPLVVRYEFKAPRFARVDGERLVLGALTFPSQLGRRYVQVGSRQTPLYIDNSEVGRTTVKMTLPAGMKVLNAAPRPFERKASFGTYRRSERQEGNVFLVDEDYRVNMGRIPPGQYEEFARYAGDVDLAQARDLVVGK